MSAQRGKQGGDKRRPSVSPLQHDGVQQQLAQLFGESLFGPWPQLRHYAGDSWKRLRPRRWLWSLAVLLLSAASVFVVTWLVRPGLEHQADNRRDHYAGELRTFIGDGDLERASEFVGLVEGRTEVELDSKDPHLDLIVASEAALYRYFDASPARLRRIRPYLDQPAQSASLRQIAALTVLSRQERADRIRELERIRNDLPERNEVDYLLATALEQLGDDTASREAWERSARLEPAWLGHRFEHAWFELRQDRLSSARQIGIEMLRVDPDSPWSRLAVECLGLPVLLQVGSIRGDAAAPASTPVQVHFQMLARAILAGARNDLSQAKARLADAAAAVEYQEPFLLDAFDSCVAENQPVLARELANLPRWPRDSKLATRTLERLSLTIPNEQKTSPLAAARAAASDRPTNQDQLNR